MYCLCGNKEMTRFSKEFIGGVSMNETLSYYDVVNAKIFPGMEIVSVTFLLKGKERQVYFKRVLKDEKVLVGTQGDRWKATDRMTEFVAHLLDFVFDIDQDMPKYED